MGGRGRGRGGASRSVLGGLLGPGESVPGRGQPPQHYPLLEHQPAPMVLSPSLVIQLAWKVDFLNCLSKATPLSGRYPWSHFPEELRPSLTRLRKSVAPAPATRSSSKISKNIDQYFERLEKNENVSKVKVEVEEPEEKDKENEEGDEVFEEEEEDTDYNQNYFDNGENYLEEEDDLDEGPVY